MEALMTLNGWELDWFMFCKTAYSQANFRIKIIIINELEQRQNIKWEEKKSMKKLFINKWPISYK